MKNNEDFKRIFEEYKRYSVKVVFRVVKDKALADDISQEVMLKLLQMGEKLDTSNERKLRSLVFTISVHKTRDYFRKANVKREQCTLDENKTEKKAAVSADPLDMILRKEKKRYEKLVLERLREEKPDYYDILMQVKYYERSPASVAEEYGISVNALNNRILRTKRWLKKELSKIYDDL